MKRNIRKQNNLWLVASRLSQKPALSIENNSIIRYELRLYIDTCKPLPFRYHYLGFARPSFMRRYYSQWMEFHNNISFK